MIQQVLDTAVEALESIEQVAGGGYLPYFVTPNALLVLGHMRCMSEARIDHPTDEDKEVMYKIAEAFNTDEGSYRVNLNEGTLAIADIPFIEANLYSRIKLKDFHEQKLIPVSKLPDTSMQSVEEYTETLFSQVNRKQQRKAHKDPMGHFGAHWMAGLLYGYPEAAVASMPPFWEFDYEHGEYRERVYEAGIAHVMDYFEASAGACIYDYPWFLADHGDIVDHQKLWSDYFSQFYDSDWHQRKKEDEAFKQTIQTAARHAEAKERSAA